MVLLQDFARMPETARLRELSGFDEFHRLSTIPSDPVQRAGFQFGDGGISDSQDWHRCRGRPCRFFGRVEYDAYRFIKVKDY